MYESPVQALVASSADKHLDRISSQRSLPIRLLASSQLSREAKTPLLDGQLRASFCVHRGLISSHLIRTPSRPAWSELAVGRVGHEKLNRGHRNQKQLLRLVKHMPRIGFVILDTHRV